jgi:hypothetical protein
MFVTDPSFLDRMAKATKDVNDAVAQLLLSADVAAPLDAASMAHQLKKIGDGVEMIDKVWR